MYCWLWINHTPAATAPSTRNCQERLKACQCMSSRHQRWWQVPQMARSEPPLSCGRCMVTKVQCRACATPCIELIRSLTSLQYLTVLDHAAGNWSSCCVCLRGMLIITRKLKNIYCIARLVGTSLVVAPPTCYRPVKQWCDRCCHRSAFAIPPRLYFWQVALCFAATESTAHRNCLITTSTQKQQIPH